MTTPLRVLVVDDEPLARRGVMARLALAPDIAIAGECASGREAARFLDRHVEDVDVVFLDVQMPGLDGFAVIEQIGTDRMPVIIFLTAHDEHALRAFEASALDYLLKPIDDERFAQALARARERVRERSLARRTEESALASTVSEQPIRLAIRDRGRVVLVEDRDVDWVEADGDYVRLHVGGKRHLVRETMTAMEARLPGTRFVRIHRSAIVNVSRVRELVPHTNREYLIVLHDGTRLKLSRSFRERVETLLRDTR
jgi:two-component system, LytTR family, response regulator